MEATEEMRQDVFFEMKRQLIKGLNDANNKLSVISRSVDGFEYSHYGDTIRTDDILKASDIDSLCCAISWELKSSKETMMDAKIKALNVMNKLKEIQEQGTESEEEDHQEKSFDEEQSNKLFSLVSDLVEDGACESNIEVFNDLMIESDGSNAATLATMSNFLIKAKRIVENVND